MQPDDEWGSWRADRLERSRSAISPVRFALVFGTAAIALGLFAASFFDAGDGIDQYADLGPAAGIDRMVTGSVRHPKSYIVRKSVLQSSPNAVCIIRGNGSQSGEC